MLNNLLSAEICCLILECAISRCVLVITLMSIPNAVVFRWIALDPTYDKQSLVQVMAWNYQTTGQSLKLNQSWLRSTISYDITRPQWVNPPLRLCVLISETATRKENRIYVCPFAKALQPTVACFRWKRCRLNTAFPLQCKQPVYDCSKSCKSIHHRHHNLSLQITIAFDVAVLIWIVWYFVSV